MTPQFHFMVVAPIPAAGIDDLRSLLLSMNTTGGDADPANGMFPFGEFSRLHFARFVMLSDRTMADITVYGLPAPSYPSYLAFLGEFDGPSEDIFAEFAERAGVGLTQIFSYCEGFSPWRDIAGWMRAHDVSVSAMYINQLGRTTLSVRENVALYDALQEYIVTHDAALRVQPAAGMFAQLKRFIGSEVQQGRLSLTPEESTPAAWQLEQILHLIGVPIVLLLLTPLLLLFSPLLIFLLWRHESTDPEIAPRIDLEHANALAAIEDRDTTNQFSAFGSIKPGPFRRWLLVFVLWIIQYTTQHIYDRSRLARVSTIHFARWVWIDGHKRLFFASNYDGSLEAYMDDFINKVSFGLNAVFSNGIGYPTSRWLIAQGAKDEQKFKYYIRRHQLPTEVWYNAHPGLSAYAMQRNETIRQGIERDSMTEAEASAWLGLL
jgi:hypothetical protein